MHKQRHVGPVRQVGEQMHGFRGDKSVLSAAFEWVFKIRQFRTCATALNKILIQSCCTPYYAEDYTANNVAY